jgi:uncharacterized protein
VNKRKIINDPVYGFTTLPDDLIYDIIQHPYFQRLRRIKQLGLTDFVYPGASHSRFQHAIGALHLMTLAIETLRSKGIAISNLEAQGAQLAILLHDMGHSPYSHALEYKLIPIAHESISLAFMRSLDRHFNGQLKEAIRIFSNQHPKAFLHQLVSGQLDMDRMDYLNRDSFFSGVAEGVIGYERIIHMLNVREDQLVVEEKGIYSIEKFLHSRKIMYWQVYLHKTVVAAEKMLVHWLEKLIESGNLRQTLPTLYALQKISIEKSEDWLPLFASLDDTDIVYALKKSASLSNPAIQELAHRLLHRDLYKCEWSDKPFAKATIQRIKKKNDKAWIGLGKETNEGYQVDTNEIFILQKDGQRIPLSQYPSISSLIGKETKYYLITER